MYMYMYIPLSCQDIHWTIPPKCFLPDFFFSIPGGGSGRAFTTGLAVAPIG